MRTVAGDETLGKKKGKSNKNSLRRRSATIHISLWHVLRRPPQEFVLILLLCKVVMDDINSMEYQSLPGTAQFGGGYACIGGPAIYKSRWLVGSDVFRIGIGSGRLQMFYSRRRWNGLNRQWCWLVEKY